jgi:hypothetical protein
LLTLALMMPQMRRQQQEARQTRAAREAVLKLLGTRQPGPLGATLGQVGPVGQIGLGTAEAGRTPGLPARKVLGEGALAAAMDPTAASRVSRAWVPGREIGLDEVLGGDEFRRAAAVAAAHGMPQYLGMRPAGWTPSREQQQQGWGWEHGGERSVIESGLTTRARLGADSRVRIAELRQAAQIDPQTEMILKYGSAQGRALLLAAAAERKRGQDAMDKMNTIALDPGQMDQYAAVAQDAFQRAKEMAGQAQQMMVLELLKRTGPGTAGAAGATAALPAGTAAAPSPPAGTVAPAGFGPDGKPLPGTQDPAILAAAGVRVPAGVPTTMPTVKRPARSRMQVQQDMRVQLEHVRAGLKKANSPNATQGEKIKAAGEALSAFFGLAPEEARGLAALSPSMQVQALKQRGLIAESDDRDVMALTRTILSRMRLRSEVAKDPQKMKEVVTNASGVAQELISSWRQKPTGGAGGGQAQTASGRDLASMGPMKFVQQYRAKGISDEQLRVALAAARVSKAKIDQALGQGRPAQVAQR